MKDLILHEHTEKHLESFAAAPVHAVILVGQAGSGKQTLALMLAEIILDLAPGSFINYPYKLIIRLGENKSIGIESVRQLERFLSLQVPRAAAYNRVVIIENAEFLTIEAQNALLKTLEEPPKGTIIIICASHEQALLPTVRSRSQSIAVKRPGQTETEAYFKSHGYDEKNIGRAYAIAGGLPGLMQALLDQSHHPLLKATDTARQLLSRPAYERLLLIDDLSKEPSLALETTQILQQMANVKLGSAEGPAAQKWLSVMAAAYEANEDLAASVQPKLALTKLMLSI